MSRVDEAQIRNALFRKNSVLNTHVVHFGGGNLVLSTVLPCVVSFVTGILFLSCIVNRNLFRFSSTIIEYSEVHYSKYHQVYYSHFKSVEICEESNQV